MSRTNQTTNHQEVFECLSRLAVLAGKPSISRKLGVVKGPLIQGFCEYFFSGVINPGNKEVEMAARKKLIQTVHGTFGMRYRFNEGEYYFEDDNATQKAMG